MKNMRIGKDIALAWAIRTSNDEKLSDIELSIDMKDPRGNVIALSQFEVVDDKVTIGLKGTAFKFLGNYTLTAWKNKGKDGQTMVDAINAFSLVASTDMEGG